MNTDMAILVTLHSRLSPSFRASGDFWELLPYAPRHVLASLWQGTV